MGAIENMDKVHNLIGLLEAWADWQKAQGQAGLS